MERGYAPIPPPPKGDGSLGEHIMDELEKLLEKEEKIVDDWHNHVPLGRKPSRKYDEDNVWYSRAEYR